MLTNTESKKTYKISNVLLQNPPKIEGVEFIDENDKSEVKRLTVADFKIVRAIIYKMQEKYKNLKDVDCEIEAIKQLKNKFIKLNIDYKYKKNAHKIVFSDENQVRDIMIAEKSKEILKNKVNNKFEFSVDEIIEIANIKSRNAHYIRKKLTTMIVKTFYDAIEHKVNDEGVIYESIVSFSLIGSIRSERGKIYLSVVEDAIPYLFGLTKNYTLIEMLNMSKLKSIYSLILYELLKKNYKIQKQFVYKFEYLKKIFNSNRDFGTFRQKVLQTGIDEIQAVMGMDIYVTKIKEGKSVVAVKIIASNVPWDKNKMSSKSDNEIFAQFLLAKEAIENKITFIEYQKRIKECLKLVNKKELPNENFYRSNFKDAIKEIKIIEEVIKEAQLQSYISYDEWYFTFLLNENNQHLASSALECRAVIKKLHPQTIEIFKKIDIKYIEEDDQKTIDAKEISAEVLKIFSYKLFILDEEREKAERESYSLLATYSKKQILATIIWLMSKKGTFDRNNTYDIDVFFKNFKKYYHKTFVNDKKIQETQNKDDIEIFVNSFIEKLVQIDKYFSSNKNTDKTKSQMWKDTAIDKITTKENKNIFDENEKEILRKINREWISYNIDTIHYKEPKEKLYKLAKDLLKNL